MISLNRANCEHPTARYVGGKAIVEGMGRNRPGSTAGLDRRPNNPLHAGIVSLVAANGTAGGIHVQPGGWNNRLSALFFVSVRICTFQRIEPVHSALSRLTISLVSILKWYVFL